MKKSGGAIEGYFLAGEVKFYKDLTEEKLRSIVKSKWDELALTEEFLQKRKGATFLTLIEIKKPTKFRIPVSVKKRSLSGWVVLGGESQRQIQLF
jgi:hypothetical protein